MNAVFSPRYRAPIMYKLTLSASLVGLLIGCMSFFVSDDSKGLFAWLYFYTPVLWLLWIGCAFSMSDKYSLRDLSLLWIIIDLIPLSLFTSFSVGVENFYQSKGTDVVVLVAYFPVVMPLGLVLKLLPGAVSDYLNIAPYVGYSGVGGAFSMWLESSFLAVAQSFMIVLIFRAFNQIRNNLGHAKS